MKQLPYEAIKSITPPAYSIKIKLVLDRLRTPQNIASFFRLADALAIDELIFYQTTFEKYQIEKMSRSTANRVVFQHADQIESLTPLIDDSLVIGLEWTDESKPMYQHQYPQNLALVIGSERYGMDQELLDICQSTIHIPMLGNNSSMNVAMAAGMACYEVRRQDFLAHQLSI